MSVALMTPGPISDQSWNGGAYAGLLQIRDSIGARISHIQTKTPAEFEENFRQYGSQGFDLVFGHGFEFQDAALRVAPQFPGTIFVVTSGNRAAGNVVALSFAFEEASYLAGIVAGGRTRTNVIGAIGGTELPPVKRSFEAFARGARSVNPQVRVITSYIGNWDDVTAGREQALAQIGQRVDVIFQNADAAGLGVFQAARDASSRAVRVIGANADQNSIAPEVTLGSVVIDLPHAFLEVARRFRDGSRPSGIIELGTQSNTVRWTPNPALPDEIDSVTSARVDSVRARLAAGTLELEEARP
jgi:basic membrane protein A and related proteins